MGALCFLVLYLVCLIELQIRIELDLLSLSYNFIQGAIGSGLITSCLFLLSTSLKFSCYFFLCIVYKLLLTLIFSYPSLFLWVSVICLLLLFAFHYVPFCILYLCPLKTWVHQEAFVSGDAFYFASSIGSSVVELAEFILERAYGSWAISLLDSGLEVIFICPFPQQTFVGMHNLV